MNNFYKMLLNAIIVSLFAISSAWVSAETKPQLPEQAAEAAKEATEQANAFIETVNINKADAATLAKLLNGVGEKKAQAIVAFREANGPFKSAEELTQVKGIGEATLAKNKAAIVLE